MTMPALFFFAVSSAMQSCNASSSSVCEDGAGALSRNSNSECSSAGSKEDGMPGE